MQTEMPVPRASIDNGYGLLWASLPIATLIVDHGDRIAEINPAAELLFNRSQKNLCGLPLVELFSNDRNVGADLRQVRYRSSPILLDNVRICSGGRRPFVASVHLAPMGDEPQFIVACVRSREIEGKIEPGNRSKSAARSAVGMAEMLSHEIKNPLAGIKGAAQLLSMNLSGEDLELTELIVEETRRILVLLQQVEQFGNTGAASFKALNVHDLLDRAVQLARVGFSGGARFEQKFDPSLPAILGDEDRLLRVFLNLIKNSCEAFDSPGGLVSIKTFYDQFLRVKSTVGINTALPIHVEIADDGPGLSPEISSNAFEPFVSGKRNGTGLGLALVSTILADLGGWISFESRPGRTVFRVSLPVAGQVEVID